MAKTVTVTDHTTYDLTAEYILSIQQEREFFNLKIKWLHDLGTQKKYNVSFINFWHNWYKERIKEIEQIIFN